MATTKRVVIKRARPNLTSGFTGTMKKDGLMASLLFLKLLSRVGIKNAEYLIKKKQKIKAV
jgi:hypothetical protein